MTPERVPLDPPIPGAVFVFGSNLAGRHGAGAALYALHKHGAIYGQGAGPQGNSYAIPTKDHKLKPLPLIEIRKYVGLFLFWAKATPEKAFQVTRIGCGLAGYTDQQIAPMFDLYPKNVILPRVWIAMAPYWHAPRPHPG